MCLRILFLCVFLLLLFRAFRACANMEFQVDAFLQAHDSGLSEADKEVAKELLTASPMK